MSKLSKFITFATIAYVAIPIDALPGPIDDILLIAAAVFVSRLIKGRK